MRRIWDETWTLDNAGHLALFIIFAALVYFPPQHIAALIVPTLILFGREKLQWNCHIGTWKFWKGWPWQGPEWSFHKHMEWLAPSVGGIILALLLMLWSWQ